MQQDAPTQMGQESDALAASLASTRNAAMGALLSRGTSAAASTDAGADGSPAEVCKVQCSQGKKKEEKEKEMKGTRSHTRGWQVG